MILNSTLHSVAPVKTQTVSFRCSLIVYRRTLHPEDSEMEAMVFVEELMGLLMEPFKGTLLEHRNNAFLVCPFIQYLLLCVNGCYATLPAFLNFP